MKRQSGILNTPSKADLRWEQLPKAPKGRMTALSIFNCKSTPAYHGANQRERLLCARTNLRDPLLHGKQERSGSPDLLGP
jgi:hypothetical protein